jgi:uncharacterized protein YdbL (DUF1318 family)
MGRKERHMPERRLIWPVGSLILWLTAVVPAFSMSVEEAKTKGLVGEKPNGYLGVVKPGSQEAQSLTNEVNQKRRQAYEDIASRNHTQIDAVEALAGEKAIQNTKAGHFIEGPDGWTKK